MALDAITGQKFVDRILFEAGKKAPSGDFPPDWWVDAINESVDSAVIQLIPVCGFRFAVVTTPTIVTNTLDLSASGLVPYGNIDQKPPTIIYVLDNGNVEINWIHPKDAKIISTISGYDNTKYWYLLGSIITVALGSGATATGVWSVCHAKRRTAITALSGSIDLDREFIPIIKADVNAKFISRLQMIDNKVTGDELAKAKKTYAESLSRFGVQV